MPDTTNSVIRRLQYVFGISLILLLLSSVASYVSIQRLVDSSKWVAHTHNVINESEALFSSLRDAESNHRGYLLTHDENILLAFKSRKPIAINQLNKLKELTSDNLAQQQRIAALKIIIQERFSQFDKTLHTDSVVRAGLSNATLDNTPQIVYGQQIMVRLRNQLREIQDQEKNLLEVRDKELATYINLTLPIIIITAIISLCITLLSYTRIKKDMDERLAKQKLEEEKYKRNDRRISMIEQVTGGLANGNYDMRSTDEGNDEIGRISTALNVMAGSLEKNFTELERKDWLKTGAAKISDAIRGQKPLQELAEGAMGQLADHMQFSIASFYATGHSGYMELISNHAATGAPAIIETTDGIIGQALRGGKVITIDDLPGSYLSVKTSLGSVTPNHITVVPLLVGHMRVGAIEIGTLKKLSADEHELLESVQESIAIAVQSAINNKRMQELLEETQSQAEELQSQHNELENINAELEAQAQKLQASEEELKVQQEELMHANQELEENTRALEERNQLIVERNHEIQRKAEDLALATKYKSEFLANMSHELRTPLNSILLLSRLLSENNEKNLNDDQVEYAQVIQSSGNGLLNLIDEILDLSKIESGKMQLEYSTVLVNEIINDMRAIFLPVANEKHIELRLNAANDVPGTIETDKMRLEQILRNLLSNALKFTSQGHVSLSIAAGEDQVIFTVKDTGIGIPKEKQQLIFEAFQQADGSTRRKFGGTGLGLSISRELAKLLGGEIHLQSNVEEGSEFIVTIPVSQSAAKKIAANTFTETTIVAEQTDSEQEEQVERKKLISDIIPANIPDDRNDIQAGDKSILIIEDDTPFAKALMDYTRKQGYKALSAVRGDEGIELARKYNPAGILLDIMLPVKDGWEVLEELKKDRNTRHIPVHTMSSNEFKKESLSKGAVNFINKPVAMEQMQLIFGKLEQVLSKEHKKVLIVEENPKHATALAYFLENFNVNTEIKHDINEGVKALNTDNVDCVILDMGIPDQKAYEMLEEVKKNPGFEQLPIIVFTGKSLSKNEEFKIRQYADSIVVKTAHSYKRILDEVSLFLHLVEEHNRPVLETRNKRLGALKEVLEGKTVLIADDDVRNIFSLTKALENMKMNVITAIDGKEALKQLDQNPNVDIVLMDMMMPEMDGYESTAQIRKNTKYRNLPVIAVTAKAMSGDREKCISAGASDYISKPVDIDQLLSLLRVWLYDKSI